ncbi:hypothetical protein [Hoyosella altamirensis]|uniref:Uncharacterized protein n=1 Tax=Hoyosella altamirensis TaxID=616997 RepID=A0A839RWI0_9ACTN|nr:hypothetical protein [Hoyosella altamirensis]MBB3040101.1 hypothetical protein [Hoyosella altamirensis]
MASTSSQISARAQARKRTQEALAQRRRRDEENAKYLDTFFEAVERESVIDEETERKIVRLRADAEEKKRALAAAKRDALAGIKNNGENIGTIAEWTGMSAKETRAVLGHKRHEKETASAPAASAAHDKAAPDPELVGAAAS